MSHRLPLTAILSGLVLCACSATAATQKTSAVTVVQNGKSDWQIVCPSLSSAGAKWGVEELRKYVRQMSGCELPARPGSEAGPTLVVGLRADLSPDEQSSLPPPAQGHDGYAIAVRAGQEGKPARIVIAGDNGRGVAYGVYDLLERFGCRWCYPTQDTKDPEVVPHRDTLALEASVWAVASPIAYRICNGSAWFFEVDHPAAAKQLDWAFKNRYNTMGWQSESKTSLVSQYEGMAKAGLLADLDRREMFLHGPGHSFDQFLKADDHIAQHPEWFGMRDGKRVPQNFFGAQFCWSNAEARKEFTDHVEAFITSCPQIHIMFIIPFDGGIACACSECARIGASNLLMTVMSEVAQRLETSAPHVLVETLGGYGPVTNPPTDVAIHPRLRILWAHWGRYYRIPYGDNRYDRKENLETWRKAARSGMTICQYYTDNFAEPWVLPPFALVLQGDRQYFIDQHIDSVYMLMWPRGYWWNHSLNGYLGGRCFYDASLDPFKEIQDYALHYFGEQAGPLLGAYYEQWARQVDLAYRVKDDSRDSDRAMLAAQRRDWIDPAVAAVKGDELLAYRVGKVEKLHTLAERLTEAHRQRDQIRQLRREGDFAKAEERLASARSFTDDIIKLFYALADLNEGLIERNEVPSFITSNVKGWLDTEAKAIAAKNRESR